jgi:hypothetical protein
MPYIQDGPMVCHDGYRICINFSSVVLDLKSKV